MHRYPIAGVFVCTIAALITGCMSQSPPAERELQAFRSVRTESKALPPHPRLVASPEDFAQIPAATDATLLHWRDEFLADAKARAKDPPLTYKPEKGIEIARDLERRVTLLAIAYQVTHNADYLARARQDLLDACNFPDWDHPSFLATAEMTSAVALGYDWLYKDLAEEDRALIRQAIIVKGLSAGQRAYQQQAFWVKAKHNWNLVCNSGMILGALAVLDEDQAVAAEVFDSARASLVHGLAGFAPDGGWEEGPTYWNYGSRYLALAMRSMQQSLGTMYGIENSPGLQRTGDFRIAVTGPTDKNFNFGDSSEPLTDAPQMFAAATLFHQPAYAAFEAAHTQSPTAFDLLWYRPSNPPDLAAMPKDELFRGIQLATFRSAWLDPSATYAGFKGGSNKAHHGHLDSGTFVLDALGERWAIDLGSDDYGAPGYFDSPERWDYYRCSTAGHNCITFDDRNQDETAVAPMIAFASTTPNAHAVVDLTKAYGTSPHPVRLLRGVALLNRRDVLVEDDIELLRPDHVTWAMHTRAQVQIGSDGRTATLTQNGQTLVARLLYPPNVTFESAPAPSPPGQQSNAGVTKLIIHFRVEEPTHIAVLFTPGAAPPEIPRLTPVSTWSDDEDLARGLELSGPSRHPSHHEISTPVWPTIPAPKHRPPVRY